MSVSFMERRNGNVGGVRDVERCDSWQYIEG